MGKRSLEQSASRGHESGHRFARVAGKVGLSALLGMNVVLGSGVAYIQHDIDQGKAELADAHPNIYPIYLTAEEDKREVATYVATGLGTRNPFETARKLTSHQELGNVFAVEYSNRDISVEELTDTIVKNAHDNGVKYLFFDGYSMGGPIELAVAARIYEDHDDLHVLGVTMNSSPVGTGGLTTESAEGGKILSTVLNYWPDLAYSKKARWAAEVIARKDDYYDKQTGDIDRAKLEKTIDSVYDEKIGNKSAASGSLISSQYNFIYRYGVEKSLATLSKEHDGKTRPTVWYTRSDDPTTDRVVNVTASAANFEKMIDKHFVPHQVIDIDNIGHANPAERPTEYNRAIFDHINPSLMSALRVDFSVGGEPEYGDAILASIPPKPRPISAPVVTPNPAPETALAIPAMRPRG